MRSTSGLPGAWPSTPGPSNSTGSFSKRGSDRNAAQPRAPSSPSPGGPGGSRVDPGGASGGVRGAVRAGGRKGGVVVQAAQPPQPHDPHVGVDHAGQLVGGVDVEPAGE